MSLNKKLKLCGLNRKFPSSLKLNKAREHVDGSSSKCKWKRMSVILFVWAVVAGFALFVIYGLSDGVTEKSPLMRERKYHFLCDRFNISQDDATLDQSSAYRSHTEKSCGCYNLCKEITWWWVLAVMMMMILGLRISGLHLKVCRNAWKQLSRQQNSTKVELHEELNMQHMQQQFARGPSKGAGNWRKKLLLLFVVGGGLFCAWLFHYMSEDITFRSKRTLANMCDERARMLQDQFNVSLNHVHALAILVSTFHHGKHPSAMDQKTFGQYTERTAFERPLTSGVAYALKVLHSQREQFEMQHGTIKKMATGDQTLVQQYDLKTMDAAPVQDEYAPVIFSQRTVSHIDSVDMMSGKEDRENILRARATGKGVLTSPFKLLKSNHLGVVLTFAVYDTEIPSDATVEQRIEATVGYLGASYDVPSLVDKLLQQLASKQTIVVNVYDTTNASAPIIMYGSNAVDTGFLHVSKVDFGDPLRKHEMHCRFKQKRPPPWSAIMTSGGILVIIMLVGHILHAAINRIAKVEEDYNKMMELKALAEAADVAKSQFLATVSHEIRTPMNGVLGMLQMLMDTGLDANQLDFAETALASGKDLISLINEVLDQAKIESGRLDLEAVAFDLRAILDNVLSLFSGKSKEKGIELAVYVSSQVPDIVIGDPGRFRQIITNLVGNSIKFTKDKGHIFVSVHLADEVKYPAETMDEVLRQSLVMSKDGGSQRCLNTLSGSATVDRWKSWADFKQLGIGSSGSRDPMEETQAIKLLVTVEDTGVGIPRDAQKRIFTPFMQADSSTSRTYGGTGIGLSICKRLVGLMEGEIGFTSEPGTGSTFSFTAVLKRGELLSHLDVKGQNCEATVSEFRGFRALVIDRRSIRGEVTRYHLRRLGIFADALPGLEPAGPYFSSAQNMSGLALAMVLIDEDVWEKDSIIAIRRWLTDGRSTGSTRCQVPKIFLLASALNSSAEHGVVKGAGLADHILTKPLRLSVLVASFQEAFSNGRKRPLSRKKQPAIRGNILNGKRVLVVDDNVVNRRVAEGALKKYGAIVSCVDSGKVALERLKPPHNFDACFMDLQMPEMDGFEATRRIRDMEREYNNEKEAETTREEAASSGGGLAADSADWHTPILAMTADVIQATNEECAKCGMDGYVAKPFEESQLYSAVARFLESG
ncbi:Histidine kinase 2 [Dionaea muscipula]